MRARERIIRDRFADRTCPHCGTLYLPDCVVVLVRRRLLWMVMARCYECQSRGLFIVSFAHDEGTGEPADDEQFADDELSAIARFAGAVPASPETPSSVRRPTEAVTEADVHLMREFLNRFTGDFYSLFSTHQSRYADDMP